MKRARNLMVLAVLLVAAAAFVLAPGASAQTGSVSGVILDLNAKPYAGLTIEAVSDQGAKQEAKTDAEGRYQIRSLRPGVYDIWVASFPPPNDKQPRYQMAKVRVQSNEDAKADANFKDILAKQGAAAQEEVKKREEEQKKFQGMKMHYEQGVGFLTQAGQARADLAKAPPTRRTPSRRKSRIWRIRLLPSWKRRRLRRQRKTPTFT